MVPEESSHLRRLAGLIGGSDGASAGEVRVAGVRHCLSRLNRAMGTRTLRVMEKGTVKFYNETKGFGFIRVEGSGQEIFVHKTGLIDTVRENDAVVFDVQDGKKGLNAVNVRLG